MKANKLIPHLWILISLLFTIHNSAQNNIVGYEYAFNDGEGLQYVSVTPTLSFNLVTDIDVSALTNDVNIIHIRFLDENGFWSSIVSKIFIKPPEVINADASIIGYEYAFNNGEGLQFISITPAQDFNLVTDIDVSSLTNDVNIFHIRFLDDQGRWSSFISNIFIKPPNNAIANANIVGYEYGFNNGEGIQFVSVAPTQDFSLISDIDVSSLPNDVNIFHIRFLDDQGRWSSFISHIFIRPPNLTNANASLVGYEYGFNDGEGIQFVPIAATNDYNLVTVIDASSLQNTVNQIHIRFQDDQGRWSSMISQIFIKPPVPQVYGDNALVAYDYWFENNIANKISVAIEPSQSDFILAEIDVSQLWAGEYRLNTQFKDAYGNYSVVMTDTINKAVLPIASFNADLTSICVGETVSFTNSSIDYDAVAWDFNDGQTSSDLDPSHTFNSSGLFDVALTVTDSSSGLDSTAVQSIQVYDLPLNTVTVYTDPTVLSADQTGASYQWIDCTNGNIDIDGATNQTFEPSSLGDYAVAVTVNNCTLVSNCVSVTSLDVTENTLDGLVDLYPNPTKNIINIKSDIPILIKVFNLGGMEIKSIELDLGVNSFDLSRFNSGLYILKVVEKTEGSNLRQSIYKIIKD